MLTQLSGHYYEILTPALIIAGTACVCLAGAYYAKKKQKSHKEHCDPVHHPHKMFIPNLGTRFALVDSWRFRLDYHPRNITMWKSIGFPTSRPRFEKTTTNDNIISYKVDLSTPDTQLSHSLDVQMFKSGEIYRKRAFGPTIMHDKFACMITLPAGTILQIVSLNLRKSGTMGLAIEHSELNELQNIQFAVAIDECNQIIYDLV